MEASPLDTTSLKTLFTPQPLGAHERFGAGESYQFGRTTVELYTGLADTSAVARLRMAGGILLLSDVSEAKPNADGGMLIDCAKQGQEPHCSVTITKQGEIAFLYSPPSPPMGISESGMRRGVNGKEYTQTTIDIEGTPEGVRVQIKGTVDAAPRLLEPKNQRSPLTFFLIEDDPGHPEKPVYHEVWAVNKPKQELKALKLVKGTIIEAILYRHTYEVELASREKMTVTRHNLVKIMYVGSDERGHSAKRLKRRE